MKRNKSSKTAFDLMRHYELKKFLEGMVQTYLFLWEREGVISLVIVLMMPATETLKPPPLPPHSRAGSPNRRIFYLNCQDF